MATLSTATLEPGNRVRVSVMKGERHLRNLLATVTSVKGDWVRVLTDAGAERRYNISDVRLIPKSDSINT